MRIVVSLDSVVVNTHHSIHVTGLAVRSLMVIRGSAGGFHLLRYFSGVVSHQGVSGCHNTLFLSSPHHSLKASFVICLSSVLIH